MRILNILLKSIKKNPFGKIIYDRDGLTTVNNNVFMFDADFVRAESAGADRGSWKIFFGGLHNLMGCK